MTGICCCCWGSNNWGCGVIHGEVDVEDGTGEERVVVVVILLFILRLLLFKTLLFVEG
jgi:hypothetical protein